MSRRVLAIVENQDQVHDLISRLDRAGFRSTDLSVVLPEQRFSSHLAQEAPAAANPSMISDMAAIGEVAVPGLGSLLMTAPLLASIEGLAETQPRSLSASLIAMGIPEQQAKRYDSRLIAGGILVAVLVDDASWTRKAVGVLQDAGGAELSLSGELARPAG